MNRKYRSWKVRVHVIVYKQEYFYVNMLSIKWKVRATDDIFDCFVYFYISVILKIKYKACQTSSLKIHDTCVCYLN